MPRVTPGQEFASLQDFKTYLRAWSIEEKFSPAILDSDARRVRVGCRTGTDCPFRIRCNYDPELKRAKVSTLVIKHNCHDRRDPDKPAAIRGEVTKLRFLLDAVPQLMIIDQGTSTKDIIENVKAKYGQLISLRQAQKVKSTLLSIAAEQLGNDLYAGMREKYGDDTAPEEMTRGKRLRTEEHQDFNDYDEDDSFDNIDPQLRRDDSYDAIEFELPDQGNYIIARDRAKHVQPSAFRPDATFESADYEYSDEPVILDQDQDEDMRYDDDGDDDDEEDFGDAQDPNYVDEHEVESSRKQQNGTSSKRRIVEIDTRAAESTGPTAAEIRAEAAALFQQASKKFQEATQLHMQASKLFSQATEMEES